MNENGRKREKTDLEKRIYSDIQREIQKYYEEEGIEYKREEKPEDTILDFFSYLPRQISPVKRKVHYAKELLEKIKSGEMPEEHIAVLEKYEDAFSEGKDMNIFLSNNIKKVRQVDFLLYTWHLFHLHMSGKFVSDKKQMKNNRSDTLLLCIVKPEDVFFIDVIEHPEKAEEYFDIRYLEIIVSNDWMREIEFSEIEDMCPNSLEPKITDAKDIFNLYSAGINIMFEFQGKGYASFAQISSARKPVSATYKMFEVNNKIRGLNDINETYEDFRMERNEKGQWMGIAGFRTSDDSKMEVRVF